MTSSEILNKAIKENDCNRQPKSPSTGWETYRKWKQQNVSPLPKLGYLHLFRDGKLVASVNPDNMNQYSLQESNFDTFHGFGKEELLGLTPREKWSNLQLLVAELKPTYALIEVYEPFEDGLKKVGDRLYGFGNTGLVRLADVAIGCKPTFYKDFSKVGEPCFNALPNGYRLNKQGLANR